MARRCARLHSTVYHNTCLLNIFDIPWPSTASGTTDGPPASPRGVESAALIAAASTASSDARVADACSAGAFGRGVNAHGLPGSPVAASR